MSNYVSSITVDQVIDALKAYLLPFIPDGANKIVRGQSNRVPMPAAPCVVLTELLQVDLSIQRTDYQPPTDPIPAIGTATIHGPARIDVQCDFYGTSSGEYCKAVKSTFKSMWGASQFPANIQPLYSSDGVQAPLITGEAQYEARWTLTVSLQYNPVVTVPQEFADDLAALPVIAADV